jgi:choline dehydrogenase-like flavoprotein
MEHPRLLSGEIKFAKRWTPNRLYDIKYNYHNPSISAHGTCIAAQLSLNPEVQKSERLLNSRISFSSVFPGEGSPGAVTLWRCKEALLKKDLRKIKLGRDLYSLLRSPLDVTGYSLTRLYRPRSLIRGVKFQIILEQEPNPLSRIKLIRERDKLGMQKVSIDWRLGQLEKNTINRTLAIVSENLQRINVIEQVYFDHTPADGNWPANLEGAWHHMGTTRMHESPQKGVVDVNCRVHHKTNLYVAGSSVFPTSGANFPTITQVALAIRLADHLKSKINNEKIALLEKVM